MTNELPNAVVLMHDPTFRDWAIAAASYQARVVILEPADTPDHEPRLELAKIVLGVPTAVADRLVTILATDPAVCSKGTTVAAVGQALFLSKIEEIWTVLAQVHLNRI